MSLVARSLGLALSLLAAAAAQAEIVDVAWNGEGRFERRLTVAPGKFAEACARLGRGDAVAWRFEASGPLDFNIHFHEGKEVRYRERRDALAGADGRLEVMLEQDYCWMWANKSPRPVDLRLLLAR